MSKEIKVSASILSADFAHLADEIKKCEDSGVDMIHVDVMDGRFVPVISIGIQIVEAVRSVTKLPIDVHFMIENPGHHVEQFIDAGADLLSVHAECYGHRRQHCLQWDQYPKEIDILDVDNAQKDIELIKNKNKKAMMVLNPGTPAQVLNPVLDDLDGVLIMSVNPGYSNQKFMPEVLSKVEYLRSKFDGDISIDGGIKAETAPDAVKAGVNILATASYFFGASNPAKAVDFLKNLAG